MKHIKLFESKNQELWSVINVPQTGIGDVSIDIFDDEESAINYFIDTVNNIAKNDKYHEDDEDYDDDENLIFTLEDAKDYINNNDYNVDYVKIYNKGTYDLPQSLKLGRDTKKYNL